MSDYKFHIIKIFKLLIMFWFLIVLKNQLSKKKFNFHRLKMVRSGAFLHNKYDIFV